MTVIGFETIRTKSLETAKQLGYAINHGLPLLHSNHVVRESTIVIDRLLGMYGIAAVAYGFERIRTIRWLERNADMSLLTTRERRFLVTGLGETQDFKFQIEGIWALYWSCSLTDEFSFSEQCPNDFVTRLPNLKVDENAQEFKSRVRLRSDIDIVVMADLTYCLHWAVRDSQVRRLEPPGHLPEYAVRERRLAIDWLLVSDDWDEITLDT